MNGSSSNITNSTGRSFPSPFSVQSDGVSPGFHQNGTYQGFHSMHGGFNIPSTGGALPSRNSSMNVAPSAGIQQLAGSHLAGRFGSNDLPVALSQISHGSSYGHSGFTNRGGMNFIGNPVYNSSTNSAGGPIPRILQASAAIGNHGAAPGIGAPPFLGNADSQITNAMGNVIGSGSGYITRSSSGGLSMPGLSSHLSLSTNSGSGNIGLQTNRSMSGGLQQAGWNSYASGGGSLSQSHAQAVNNLNSMAMLNDVNSNDKSPFSADDFPVLTNRPNSAGGARGQIGLMRKQRIGGPTSQHNQEFSIQNEDFPALPGTKGGNADYSMDFLQKNQLRNSSVSMMQNQHFSMGRSTGFTLGGAYPSPQPQKHQLNMPLASGGSDSFVPVNHPGHPQLQGPDTFPSSNSMYYIQPNGPPDSGVRSMNNITAMSSYDQQMQQYQQQIPPSFQLQHMPTIDPSFWDQGVNSIQATHAAPDPYSLLGLLGVIQRNNPDLTPLALGIDLTSLGLDLNSSEELHKTFSSPWSDKTIKGDPEFVPPQCYNESPPPPLNHAQG